MNMSKLLTDDDLVWRPQLRNEEFNEIATPLPLPNSNITKYSIIVFQTLF